MPWIPELFPAPALAQFEDKRRGEKLIAVNYFAGLMAGEIDALIDSFAGEPELHHLVRGRVKGARAFAAFVAEANAWLEERDVSIEDVNVVVTEHRGVEEVVLHLGGETGHVDLPVAIVADRQSGGRIDELRLYFSSWPLTGRHANRPPLLQPDPLLRGPGVVGEYQRALATGDLDAILAASVSSTSSSSQTPVGSQWSTAPSPTMGARAHWSTTWCGGARPSCRRRRASQSMFWVRAASWLPPASTTTPTLRSIDLSPRPPETHAG